MIDFVHKYERENKPKWHLVLMSPGGNDVRGHWISRPKTDVTNSHADVIAVLNGWSDCVNDPPANDSVRPAIIDRDHVNPQDSPNHLLPWKALVRGYHYCLFEDSTNFEDPSAKGVSRELARKSVGAAVLYSRRFANLARATPHNELSSTRYCLADPGHDYLVLQPDAGKPFTVRTEAGRYRYEWFRVDTTTVSATGTVQSGGGNQEFVSPFEAPAVLCLNAATRSGGDHPKDH
jgi:hypothetical protein